MTGSINRPLLFLDRAATFLVTLYCLNGVVRFTFKKMSFYFLDQKEDEIRAIEGKWDSHFTHIPFRRIAQSSFSFIFTNQSPIRSFTYIGFPEGIMGGEMMDKFREQSVRFGTEIHTETIGKVDLTTQPIKLWREGEEDNEEPTDTANSVIIATGASAKRMNLPGEETYWQAGISACAVCDGAVPIFRNKPLAVVGGGDSAAEEAVYLTKYGMYLLFIGC